MGVFDSDFSKALQDKPAINAAETPNEYESGGLTADFGINQNDFKDNSWMETISEIPHSKSRLQPDLHRATTHI